jgi:nucleotide-binding universal stress UspA family protein
MSYAALMVHMDGTPASTKRVRLAADLANRFQSALIGVAGRCFLPSFLADGAATEPGQENGEQQEMLKLFAEMERRLRVAAKSVAQVEWRGVLGYANDLVPIEARAVDLVVVGRRQNPDDLYFTLDPGLTILRAGRPVLVVPEQIDSLVAQRIVVAWKDTREARRAARDALPLLQQAKEVTIVEVSEADEPYAHKRLDDVANYLVRHKVAVAGTYLQTKRPVASELLRFANEEKADLIVAGAYGHNRLSELIFGGATRDLLADSPICCLFSH